MSTIAPPAAPATAAKGRSLWRNAWLRLRANRAAVVSMVCLGLIVVACVAGPWLSPHAYDAVYRNYVKVPASLSAHPRTAEIEPIVGKALARARLEVLSLTLEGETVIIEVRSRRSIDPRVARYLERADVFRDARVASVTENGLEGTLTAEIDRQRFLFGTDANGRDLLTRTLIGGRVSLLIGVLATLVALLIGVSYGALAGYLGGAADQAMMRLVDILYSLPFIFFVILLVVFFGRNYVLMFIAVGAVEWLDMARIVRGQTLSIKRQEYVQAAEALGVSRLGILRRHVVPNTLGPVVVYVTLLVPKVILLESFLSFLGLGVQEPMTSWGVLISEGARNLQGAPWMLIFPSLFLTVTLFTLNFIGDGLRDALDPKDR